jgi:hypothetical protein
MLFAPLGRIPIMYKPRWTFRGFLFVLAISLAGCGPSLEERLIGTWEADTSGKLAELQAEGQANPLAQLAAKAAESAAITVHFKPEGKLALNRKIGVISIDTVGVWQIVDESADPPKIEMRYPKKKSAPMMPWQNKSDDAGASEAAEEVVHQTTVTFENENRIQLSLKIFGEHAELLPYDRVMEP